MKWEYLCVYNVFLDGHYTVEMVGGFNISHSDESEHILNTLGQQGWELVLRNPDLGGSFVFKRPLASS